MSDTPEDTGPLRRLASTSTSEPQDATEVARIRPRPKVTTGKPRRLAKTAGMKLAYGVMSASGVSSATAGNFYSPELSTDFLELPQSLYEQWNYYRFFYRKNPFVGQALDLHTELPLSKVRLNRFEGMLALPRPSAAAPAGTLALTRPWPAGVRLKV